MTTHARLAILLPLLGALAVSCSPEAPVEEAQPTPEIIEEPEPEVEVEGFEEDEERPERRPSALERREATLERQRQEREALPPVNHAGEPAELVKVEASTADPTNFGVEGDALTLTFSQEMATRSAPLVRFDRTYATDCAYDWVECSVRGDEIELLWPGTYRPRDLSDTSVIEVHNVFDEENGLGVAITEPVPVAWSERAPEPEEESEPELTAGQSNAMRTARDYLGVLAFSRSGLIKQLEFEGYSNADATFAVDAIDVDWNEQAAKSARQYLDVMGFSRSGLINQLMFEGFTRQQAEYGVTEAGL